MTQASSPKNRTALVTGAARRVGRAIALRLADDGFDIAFTYLRSGADADSLIAEVKAKGRRCLGISADLFDPEAAAKTIGEKFLAFSDRMDALVNNASVYEPSALGETNLPQIRRFFAIHLESPLLLCKTFAATLRASRGHVVNMLDDLVQRPWDKYLSYCTSKAALWNLTLGLARELAPDVTVNGIAPGVAEWAAGTTDEEKKEYLANVPLNRGGPRRISPRWCEFCAARGPTSPGR